MMDVARQEHLHGLRAAHRDKRWVISAFIWGDTPEGMEFWSEYHRLGHDEGRKRLREMITEVEQELGIQHG